MNGVSAPKEYQHMGIQSVVILLLFAISPSAPAQQPLSQAPATRIETTVQEVVLDIIVRDKKGRSLRDLRPEEIEILEEGAPVKVKAFRLVEGSQEAAKGKEERAPVQAAEPPSVELDPLRQVRLVTLVFERLGVEGKRFFRQAVGDLLNLSPEANLYYSIFTIDQKLHCLQNFTNNHELVKKEAETAQKGAYAQFVSRSAAIQGQLRDLVAARGAAPPTGAQGGAAFGAAMVEAKMAELQLNALQMAESLERDYFMRSTLNSLLALARSQAGLPGRKMIVYFTEQFAVPDHLSELFNAVMSEANRANVSIYTVDAKGLITWNQSQVGRDLQVSAAGSSESIQMDEGGNPVRRDQVMVFDTAIEGLRSNVQSHLSELATNTGGFMIANTNDLKAPLRKTLEELRTYYEAVYTPSISVYDGKFRKLTVRVNRADVTVQTRNGYYALPRLGGGQQLYAYEMPLLSALSQASLPQDIDFRAAAGRFDPRGERVQYDLMIEIPMKGLQFRTDEVKKTAFTRASFMALFKDERGEVVQKFSRDFPVQVPLDKVAGYQAGNLTQMYPLRLPPGRYTLETVVVDRNTDKLSAKRADVVVPAPGEGLSISDITLVRRVEPLKEAPDPDNPFQSEGGKVTPTLSSTITGGPGTGKSFYFVVYPDAGNPAPPELTMAFFSGGQPLGEGKPELPRPDKNGRIAYIATVPGESFPAGDYQMKAIVKQGSAAAEENISFTVR